ncbi:MAG: DUF6625 family protein [Flavobacterium sp.]
MLTNNIFRLSTIALVTCWYGDYPWYFPYFIKSCFYNPTVDFIIITDNLTTIPLKPSNVKIVYNTLDNVKILFSKKLGFEVKIDRPYKLCDLKPAYGFVFSDIIAKYDFWGHGDIDLVYGNIRNFMTQKRLEIYDLLSGRPDYTAGAFTLFKNNEKMNTLFMKSKDFKKVFSNSDIFCFDECSFLFDELNAGHSVLDFPNHIQSMTYVVKKAMSENKINAFFDLIMIEGTPGKVEWNKGVVSYKGIFEAICYHFVRFKRSCNVPKKLAEIPESFYFTSKSIKTKGVLKTHP